MKQTSLLYMVCSDALKSIRDIYHYETIEYKDAFFLCIALGSFNSQINKDDNLRNETILKIRNQKLWDEDKVSTEMAVFFSYIFFNELYKDINIDTARLLKAKEPMSVAYPALRKEIITEWEKNIQMQEKNAMVFEENNNPRKRRRRSNIKLTTYNDSEEGIE